MHAAAQHATLPDPTPEALAASRRLLDGIGAELAAHGNWISFARYMECALYAPGLGYYAGGAAKLGGAGDFVTAPELGRLYGRCLARQLAELLQPGDEILEFGAGSGALAQTLLEELELLGAGGHAYCILEPSAELAGRQRARLGDRARWLDRLPQDFRGVMLANEVLDAMPVHALAWTEAGVRERGVCVNEGQLAWSERPATGAVLEAARAIEVAPRYESEIGLVGQAWIGTAARALERGALLIIDYGFPAHEYFHPQRAAGTLMCHYRHHAHADPFHLPGLQDITAHLDFSALAAAGQDAGLELLGYTSQAAFLVNCGITDLLEASDPADVRRHAPLAAEANRLLSPAEMGELFKVLALGRGIDTPLRGMAQHARSHRL